ncbi:MAG: MBL fold metallo-hydrolase [Hyphomicrobiaceae bacterium]
MKILLLGTGTPAPSLRRQSSGYLVDTGSDVIVMDHGPGAHHRLLDAGYKATDVTHLFFTHYHYDHVMDYPRMVLTRWDHGDRQTPPLKVYGPPPLREITDRFIGVQGAFALDIAARTESPASLAVYAARGGQGARPRPAPELREISPGDAVSGNGWRISVGPARHVQPYLNCQAYRLETGAGRLVYSGDNGGVYEPFIDFARDCDILIHMNHFLSGTELHEEYRRMTGSHLDVAETAKQARAKTLVLTHLLPHLDQPGVKERMVAEMAKIYDGRIIVREDLMTVPLSSNPKTTAD